MCAEWIKKVESELTIKAERVAELKRFCERFGITSLKLKDGTPLTYEQYLEGEGWDYYCIDSNLGELYSWATSDKPYVRIRQNVLIAGRKLQIYNGRVPEELEVMEPERATRFSDESLEIARAIAKVFNGVIKIYREYTDEGDPDTDNLVVELPQTDYFVIAYNRIDC